MLCYLLTMMIYPAWKISLAFEEVTDDSLQNQFDKNIGTPCDTLLNKDTFMNSDTSMHSLDIHCNKF